MSQAAVWRWANRNLASGSADAVRCWRCAPSTPPAGSYAYLLGQYLGDGHLVTHARVPVLRVYCCTDYPAILALTSDSIRDVRGVEPGLVRRRQSERLLVVQSYWKHWPCLLPQHGPGMKHTRRIALAGWQQEIVLDQPWPFIRGLNSDGWRSINRVTVRGQTYSYPRYLFAIESRDILAIFGRALDTVGVDWRYNRPNSISVARRASVAVMEHHVGPKS